MSHGCLDQSDWSADQSVASRLLSLFVACCASAVQPYHKQAAWGFASREASMPLSKHYVLQVAMYMPPRIHLCANERPVHVGIR